jgi:hypothetical protein
VLTDPGYVRWADEASVHVLSYVIDPKVPDPTVVVERDGEKTDVLARFPQFTVDEADFLAREVVGKVKVPESKPWAAVLSPDGKRVLATLVRATAAEFQDAYEGAQEELGRPFPRAAWKAVVDALARSSAAEVDERWKDAVSAAVEARRLAKEAPKPLRDRAEGQVEALSAARERLVEAAKAIEDAAARAKELARVEADFVGLPPKVDPR